MQLAGLLDPALGATASARTLAQKWDQAQAALALERTWTQARRSSRRISISRRIAAR